MLIVSFYALFLLFYLLYRLWTPYYLYGVLIFAAASFYAYSNGQAIISLAVLLLTISDFAYHRQHVRELRRRRDWRTLGLVAALALLLALPYLQRTHAADRYQNRHRCAARRWTYSIRCWMWAR